MQGCSKDRNLSNSPAFFVRFAPHWNGAERAD
jgi:hypothetical protein